MLRRVLRQDERGERYMLEKNERNRGKKNFHVAIPRGKTSEEIRRFSKEKKKSCEKSQHEGYLHGLKATLSTHNNRDV